MTTVLYPESDVLRGRDGSYFCFWEGPSGFSGAGGAFGAAGFRQFRDWGTRTARRGLQLGAINFVAVHRCGDGGENFVGEVGVVDCARDDEGSDEASIGGERLLAAKIAGVALNVAGEIVEEGAKFVGEGATDWGALACDFRSECGHGAAAAGAVAMFWREIGGGQRFEGVAGGLVDDVGPILPHP